MTIYTHIITHTLACYFAITLRIIICVSNRHTNVIEKSKILCTPYNTAHLLPTPEKDSKFYVAIKRTGTSCRPLIDPCCFKIFLVKNLT